MCGTDCMPSHQENKNVNLVGVCEATRQPLRSKKVVWFEHQLRVIYVYYLLFFFLLTFLFFFHFNVVDLVIIIN